MRSFEELSTEFNNLFSERLFPDEPPSLYEPANYFLSLGGKRIRPVMCLMANELFGPVSTDAFNVAVAIELFHNFTLIHDDIMDKAPLRRGRETVHSKFGESTALLAGDVMLVRAYDYINRIDPAHLHSVILHFNKAAREVCEGQQLDMDFEKMEHVGQEQYLRMIELKTSVLIAEGLRMGAIIGGAGKGNQDHLYHFGRNLGMAFQVQDDYLDAFGDPKKFGKQVGGDIRANKKTFLFIHAMEVCSHEVRNELRELMKGNAEDKVERVIRIFRECGVDQWANDLKEKFLGEAGRHLEEVAVPSARKDALRELMKFLVRREY